jgi:hypothetical protein
VIKKPPGNWNIVMGCNPTSPDSAVDGGGLLVGVDATQHHTGSHSVRVVGGDSCGYYFVTTSAAFAALGTQQLYARFWVMFSMGPTQGHNGFLAMNAASSTVMRLGFQSNVMDWNALPKDSTLPDLSPQGTATSLGTTAATWTSWNCIEFHVDQTNGHIEFWFNGGAQTIAGLSYPGGSMQGYNDTWAMGQPTYPLTDFGLGWLGLNNQETVWFDDVALSSTGRIGCN